MLLLLSLVLATGFGIITAVPGLLPPASTPIVTWSRVIAGVGWLGYGAAAFTTLSVPVTILPGILLAQVGYGLAVVAISRQACERKD